MSNVIVVAGNVPALRQYLEAPTVLTELQKAMPPGLDPQRLVRQTLSLVQRTPRLLQCTQVSILSGIMQAAELGLEVTGPLGQAWLIPRKVKGVMTACFQVGWKGLVLLAYRSPSLKSLTVRKVHANDEFDFAMGTEHWVRHRSALGDRGPVTHYYAVAQFQQGGSDFEVWSKAEAEAHRDRYAQVRDDSAWVTSFDAMASKSVLAALCRRLSLCPQAQMAASIDDYSDAGADMQVSGQAAGTRSRELLEHLDQSFGEIETEAQEVVAEAQP